MGLILYLPEGNASSDVLLEIIKQAIPDHDIHLYYLIGELSERLRRPILDIGVAVFYASSYSDLMEIIYLGEMLSDLRIVLVLPDSRPDMLEKAYVMCPRFIAAAESDFKHLGIIINKMVDLYSKTH